MQDLKTGAENNLLIVYHLIVHHAQKVNVGKLETRQMGPIDKQGPSEEEKWTVLRAGISPNTAKTEKPQQNNSTEGNGLTTTP